MGCPRPPVARPYGEEPEKPDHPTAETMVIGGPEHMALVAAFRAKVKPYADGRSRES